jgi:hypothetical protein
MTTRIDHASRHASLQRRLHRLESRLQALTQRAERYTWVRLAVFVGGLILSIAAYYGGGGGALVAALVASAAMFLAITVQHRRLSEAITRLAVWQRYTAAQRARLTLDWAHLPPSVADPDPAHPFEGDLDLIGDGSIHHLLNICLSRGGSDHLRAWLTQREPDLAQITRRQQIVRELAPLDRLRSRLHTEAVSAAKRPFMGWQAWEGAALERWLGHGSAHPRLGLIVAILAVLAAINLVLFALNFYLPIPGIVRAVPFALYVFISLSQIRIAGGLFESAAGLLDSLRQLRAVFDVLEEFRYQGHPHLRALCEPFLNAQTRPSRHLRGAARLMAAASLQTSQVIWLILNTAVPWDLTVAYYLERKKADLSRLLPVWLETWFAVDALNALANFAWLNPNYTFPTFDAESPLVGRALGHPLIAAERKVCNDIEIAAHGEVALITGSNMSGKSSFLRTVGVNLCLAYAGGVVNAQSLQLPLFRVFTCIRVSDSLLDGFSYFYAEVRRLKALLTALNAPHALPLFFLIDEIFRGTNNRERLIGSRAYIQALAGRNGSGAISTHDLELVHLADELPNVHNYHFADEVHDGQMTFDYRLRAGPCPTTNALRIMALEGLPVADGLPNRV